MAAPHDLPLPGPTSDLKPTTGKTPMPQKFVTLKKNVKLGKNQTLGFTPGSGYYAKTVPPKLPAPPHKSYTAAQEATLHAKQLLAPQYKQADVEAARQNEAIRRFTADAMQQLAGLAPQIGQDYTSALDAQSGLVNSAADALRNSNPQANVSALLNSIGAPASQQQSATQGLSDAFNGAAAVGQYSDSLPIGALRSQGLAAETLARLQPGFTALGGRQAQITALQNQSDARAKIGEQLPALEQSWLSSFQSNKAKQQQLALEANALGLKQSNTDFNQKIATAKYNLEVANAKTSLAKWNSTQATKATKIDPTVSKGINDGLAHNSQGAIVTGPDGKPIKFTTAANGGVKPPSATQVNSFLKGLTTPTYATVRKTANGKSVSVKVKTGQTFSMQYGQAYKRLRAMGLDDVTARKNLNTLYRRGQAGRSWLSNDEQAVLKSTLSGPRLRLVFTVKDRKGVVHGYITSNEAEILRQAGKLPEGEQGVVRGHPVWYIKPVF